MKSKFARWGLGQLLTIVMVVAAGSAFAAGESLIHNSDNLGTKNYGAWGVSGGRFGQFTCTTCHNKTTINVKRVADVLTAPQGNWSTSKSQTVPVVFNNMTAFGTDVGGHPNSTRVCQACHTKTKYHRYNTTGQTDLTHNNQTDCTTCHSHAKAFAAACNTCHGYPPSSAALGSDGLVSPATRALGNPAVVAGAHMKHDAKGMQCSTCHNLFRNTTAHQRTGTLEIGFAVRKSNFPGFGDAVAPAGSFVGNTPLNLATGSIPASYAWQGNGGTVVTTAANTTTCSVYCHGNWAGSNGGIVPSWVGGVAESTCGACHGARIDGTTGGAATVPTTNAHARHAVTLSTTTLGLTCEKCHGAHPDNNHVNGKVKWDVTGLATTYATTPQYRKAGGAYATYSTTGNLAPSASFGQCNNVYCHSNVQGANGTGAPTSFAQPTWQVGGVNCDTCHWGDVASGFKLMSTGSHRKHVAVAQANLACNACHNGAGKDTVLHADGKIQVRMKFNGYTGLYQFNGKSAGVGGFGTCTTTTCHSTGYSSITPVWGTPLAGNCLGCHGTEVSSAANLSPLHNKHLNQAATGGAFKCADCHVQVITSTDNRTIANKPLHANNMINYSGLMAGGSTRYSTVTKSCSNIYCHSNGRGVFVGMTGSKTWTGAADFKCNSCHGRSNATGAPDNVASDSHAKHAPATTDCWKCHQKTASSTAGQLVSGTVDHLDRTLDARLSVPKATFTGFSGSYNNAARTCTATYCHGGTNPTATPAWGNVNSTNCNSCHVTKPNGLSTTHGAFHIVSTSANYNYSQAAANNTASLATAYNFNCATCHGNTTAKHFNGPEANGSDATIQFLYTSAGRGVTASNKYLTRTATIGTDARGFKYAAGIAGDCNSTYCHSNGKGGDGAASITWASTSTGNCDACHGNEGNAATLSGKHSAHMTPLANLGGNFKCADCHAKTITNTNNRTLYDRSKHVNKMIDYTGLRAGGSARYSTVTKTCATIYCHSNGRGVYVSMTGSKTWNGAAVIGCNGCHGRSNATGAPDNVATDSHAKHAPTAAQCFRCHRLTASTTAGQLVPSTADHLDGGIDARLANIKPGFTTFSGVYNANKSCSATYCHGSGVTTPIWGVVNSTGCNKCHNSTPSLGGAHTFHLMSTTANYNYTNAAANTSTTNNYNFTCASCHGSTVGLHSDGPVASGSDATIFFGFSSAGRNPDYTALRTGTPVTDTKGFKWTPGTAGACNTTYCHSNGKGGNGILGTINWASGQVGTCAQCHGIATTTGVNALSGAHFRHMSSTSFRNGARLGCKDCHATTVSGVNTLVTNKALHVNKLVNYSGQYAGRNKTCNTIYCHSNGKGTPGNTTWATTNTVGCAFCHAASGLTTGNHNAHLTSPNMAVTCKYCHNNTTNNDTRITGTQHIDGTVNIVPSVALNYGLVSKLVSFGVAGTTCSNVSCHSSLPTGPYPANPVTWGMVATCDTCHPKANLSGAHGPHMGALNLNSAAVLYNMTANRTPFANDSTAVRKPHGFGCANCHPMNIANHINGSVDVDLNRVGVAGVSTLRFLNHSTAGYDKSGTKKCSNMYCHSNASRIEAESNVRLNTSLAWTDKFDKYTGASNGVNRKERCVQCHLNQPTTGAHAAHAVGNHSDNIYNGKSGKVSTSKLIGGNNISHGNPNNSTTIGCYICHNEVVTSAANDKNAKCVGCHYIGNTYGAKLKGDAKIANIGLHVNGARDIKFAPIYVKSKAQIRQESFKFYSSVWVRNTYKNMSTQSFDQSKVRLDQATAYTVGTPMNSSCSNVVCHNGKSPTWNMADWNDPNKCMDCHSKL